MCIRDRACATPFGRPYRMQEHGPARSAITVSPAPLVEDGSASLGDGGLRLAACAVVLSTAVAQCGVPGLGWTARHEVREGLPLGLAVRGPLWRSYRATSRVRPHRLRAG